MRKSEDYPDDDRVGDVKPAAAIPKKASKKFSNPFTKGQKVTIGGITHTVDGWKKGKLVLRKDRTSPLANVRHGQTLGILDMTMRVKSIKGDLVHLVLVKGAGAPDYDFPDPTDEALGMVRRLNHDGTTWYAYLNVDEGSPDYRDLQYLMVGPLTNPNTAPKRFPRDPKHPLVKMVFIGSLDVGTGEITAMKWREGLT